MLPLPAQLRSSCAVARRPPVPRVGRGGCPAITAAGMLCAALSVGLCGEPARRWFDLPADEAARALKEFSVQSGCDVVYASGVVAGVRTRAVKGEMPPRAALEAMLAATPLVAKQDAATGAFMINRAPDPNAGRAAPAGSGRDRPTRTDAPSTSPSMTTSKRPPALKRVVGAIAALFAAGNPAYAQSPAAASGPAAVREYGTVAGRVANAATGDFLAGATVTIEGTAIQATTDRGGEFTVIAPAGKHVLVATFTGLNPVQRSVEVAPGAAVTQDFSLSSDVYQLDKFVVAGIREGQAAAIQNQRQAMNSKTVAALDAFGNPGAAVGELLQRLPGVAVDIGAGGEPSSIYIRGMNQSFSSMMLDGNQLATTDGQTVAGSYIYLGQVSSSTLESLEIIKAPLPDTDGNAISGYINLRTKRAFDRAPGRRVDVAVGTKWADLHQDDSVPGKDRPKLDLFNLAYSEVFSVFGGRNNLGVAASANFNASGAYHHEAGPSLQLAVNNAFFVAPPAAGAPLQPLIRGWSSGNWNNNDENSYAKTFGLNVDYKFSDEFNVYFKTTASNTATDSGAYPSYFRWRLDVPQNATSFAAGSTYDLVRTNPVGTASLESVLYIRESEAYTFSGGLEKRLFAQTGKWTVDASYNRNRTTYPAINEVKAQVTGVAFQLDRRGQDPWLPAITQIGGPNWSDPANYSIVPSQPAGSRVIAFNTPAVRSSVQSDFQKDFATLRSYVKVGVKHATNAVRSKRSYKYYTWTGLAKDISPYVAYNIRMGEGQYGPFPFLQTPTTGLPNDLWNNPANFTQTPAQVWQTTLDSKGSLTEIKEVVDAAYVQAQARLGRLRVLGGVRVEETEPSGGSWVRRSITSGPNANNANNALSAEENAARAEANYPDFVHQQAKYTNVFPGLHFVYDFSSGLQARASYNVSITRPGGGQLLPNFNVNDVARTISKGNVDLKPYTSDNFEAALQYYFEPVGMVSAGVFLKEISNYFRTFGTTIPAGPDNGFDGQYEGYTLNMSRNVGNARVRGIELSYSQQYTFLPGFLRGLGAYANFTYLETQGDFGGLTTVTRLPNLTPRTVNAGLTYRGHGFDVRVLANYRGKTYTQTLTAGSATASGTGVGGIIGQQVFDVYNAERLLVDLKTQYFINRTYSLYMDVYNLTNQWSSERVFDAFGRENNFAAIGNGVVFHAGIKARF